MGFLSLPDPARDEDDELTPAMFTGSTRVVVTIVGSTEACGCTHCRAFDLGAGNLIHEVHVGVGTSTLDAVNDALRQCHEKHPNSEISVECWKPLRAAVPA